MQTAILIVVFLGWYMAYLFLSIYARDFMGMQIYGVINLALLLGVGQFASTLVLAWGYCLYAARRLDPLAAELRDESAAAEAVLNGRVGQG